MHVGDHNLKKLITRKELTTLLKAIILPARLTVAHFHKRNDLCCKIMASLIINVKKDYSKLYKNLSIFDFSDFTAFVPFLP